MKKAIVFLLTVMAVLFLTACGSSPTSDTSVSPAVSETPAAETTPVVSVVPSPSVAPPSVTESPVSSPSVTSDGIDVDLTQLSSTMVYSEVYAMMYEPESYLGKTVKMRGSFSAFEINEKLYFACVVPDATACCEQGLEFSLSGTHSFPEDYPERGSEITVVGIFDLYSEEHNGNTSYYIILRDAELV